MLATLTLTALLQLAPAQADLKITNDRLTRTIVGWERKDAKLFPGDVFILAFDVEGVSLKDDGKIQYSMAMEMSNKAGKQVYKQNPQPLDATNSLGGTKVPASVIAEIGTDTPPGEYTVKVTVTDLASKKTATLTKVFEVLPTQLALVRVTVTWTGGIPAPPVAVPGQVYFVQFGVVGFGLDDKRKQPNLAVEMQIFDESGKPTLPKPFTGSATEVTEEFKKLIPMQFILYLNKSGKYRMVLKVTDKISMKAAEQTLNFEVVEPK